MLTNHVVNFEQPAQGVFCVYRGKKGFAFKRVILFSDLGGEFGDDQLDTICAGIRNAEIELNVM